MNKRSAQAILASIRGGHLLNQLTDELHTAACVAHDLHKAATVTLTLTIKPEGTEGVSNAFAVFGEIATKLPRRDPPASLFFFDEEEGLSETLRKPKEPELPGIAVVHPTTATGG